MTSLTVNGGATLAIGGGSTLTVSGAISVTGNSTILLQGTDTTAQVNGSWQGVGVTINAGSVQVDHGSAISADGQGYVASCVSPGTGPGGGINGNGGGSYGGVGASNIASSIYGSQMTPVDLGSAGAGYREYSGHWDVSGGQPNGGAGTAILSNTPQFLWLTPKSDIFHDTVPLQWTADAVDLTATTVDLVASGKESLTVGSGLFPIAGLNWDTTTVPDSRYDLRLIFRDATGAIVAQVPRNILLNNSIAWHSGVLQGNQT